MKLVLILLSVSAAYSLPGALNGLGNANSFDSIGTRYSDFDTTNPIDGTVNPATNEMSDDDALEQMMESGSQQAGPTPISPGEMNPTEAEALNLKEDEIPKAAPNSIRKQIGEMKLRFLHTPNHDALRKILLRPAVINFWRAAFKFNKNKQPISTEEWKKMWNVLNEYWSKHIGMKIPVTLENWVSVNKDKNGIISVKDEIIPAMFFEADRFLFDAIVSALFQRVFDFNKNGLLDNNVFKTIKGTRLSEPKFFFNGVQWVKDIMALEKVSSREIQTLMDEISQTQGKEMVMELVKDLMVVSEATASKTVINTNTNA